MKLFESALNKNFLIKSIINTSIIEMTGISTYEPWETKNKIKVVFNWIFWFTITLVEKI